MKFIKATFDKVTKNGNVKFELDDEDDVNPLERYPSGKYVLIKVETLSDEYAIEEFMEQQKNK